MQIDEIIRNEKNKQNNKIQNNLNTSDSENDSSE
jgi:hypothetical protein